MGMISVLCLYGTQLLAIPVELAWPVRLNPKNSYDLQISPDKGFSKVVEQSKVRGPAFYKWDAPSEGVYHWRLLRPPTQEGAERNTFVSGTFVLIDPKVERKRPAIIRWDSVSGADRYKIFVLEGGVKRRIMETRDNRFFVPRLNVALMLEIVPYIGERRVNLFMHFDPSMTLEGGAPQTPAAAVIAKPIPTAAPEEPDPKPDPKPAPEEKVAVEPAPAEVEVATGRSHIINFYGYYVEESLRAQKLEIDVDSKQRLPGAGASLWTNPVSGFVITGFADYHEHKASLKREGGEPVDVLQARASAALALGWDVFPNYPEHALTFAAGAVAIQLPRYPLEFSGTPTSIPALRKVPYEMPGGLLRYGYLGENWAAQIEAGAGVLEKKDVTFAWQRLLLQVYLTEQVSLDLGGFAKLSTSVTCHEDEAVCLREGKVVTRSKEAAGTLGFGLSL